jgi:hypothetical protein
MSRRGTPIVLGPMWWRLLAAVVRARYGRG